MKTYTNAVQDKSSLLNNDQLRQDNLQTNGNYSPKEKNFFSQQKHFNGETATNYFKVIQAQADEDRPE